MNITRRAAIVGATASVAMARMAHAALPATSSPFLPVQQGPIGYSFAFVCHPSLGREVLGISKITATHPNISVDDAEDIYLAGAHVADEVRDRYPHVTRPVWLACVIRRQAALIGKRGRRGYANIALMHPALVEQIGCENLVPPEHFDGAGTRIGRWTRTGEVPKWENIGSTIWCASHLPMDEAYVVYSKAPIDSAGILLRDGHLGLAMQAVGPMSGPQQYVTRIRLIG